MTDCNFCENTADTKCGCGYHLCALCFNKHLDDMDYRDELWPEEEKAIEKYMESFYTLLYPFEEELREDWEDWPVTVVHPWVDTYIDIIGRDH